MRNKDKTHCIRGHPLSGENLLFVVNRSHHNGWRVCRSCNVVKSRRYRQLHPEIVSEKQRMYRATHKDQRREYRRHLYEDKREFIKEVVGEICVDCAEDRPNSIEYHHPQGNLRAKESQWRRGGLFHLGWEDLKEEIMSLIVLCGTCHNLRHRGETV